MRILSNEDVMKVLKPEDCINHLEKAYKDYTQGLGENRPRTHTYFPVEDERYPGFQYRFKSQEGGTVSTGVWALRITSDMVGSETLTGGVQRRRLLPIASGDKYCGLVTLYSLTKLEPIAIMHDSYIQKMRVGATSALGIREMSNPDAKVAGLFGSGWQAESHLLFLLMVRPNLEEVRVFSPTMENRENFAKKMSEETGKRIVAVDHPKKAVEGCQIVTCATAANDPCFDGDWLEPGTHVTCITNPDGTATRRELDDRTYDRADRLVVFSKEQIHHDKQYDILGPVDRGRMTYEDIGGLGDLLLGNISGRDNPDQITVFANNTGMGLQFAAVGALILEQAEKQNLGHVIPTDWFLEETSP
ncbi:ornithine cyclodeaminase family protein [Halalkalibacter alkaliphilus]|uniref:Ornithine cyclodeaminase family protein n=1 Tax=Halalkalibacter alkaliphilus TaxID=2917993 RepID=A0A9X2CUX9_9BACI|nr:ornithine cyclodeaminase family protein [Halalkalibacter alkaliphilus]MCL7748550.1 ornithine cyclodeaminase family protein [Halalkalibacter alkaliphilus]